LQTLSLLGEVLRKTLAEPKAQEVCTKQNDAVAHLADLLNSILEFCELESGDVQPTITEVAVQDVFRQLRDEFESQAQAKQLQLRFSSQAEIAFSDQILLTQILRSLVSNAIRYSEQGDIDVNCQRESSGLRVSVMDYGMGIASDELAIIFDEFYRVKNDPVDRSSGRGLGLSIVDRGLALLQSKIEVQSKPGHGSTFSFVLPVAD
jgi:signal transduction histidine kinase